mmetsp:Transcript_11069/g.11159  ORF Transcript_11069/g.11159 Transcript_11069/m.11159 type:complete len:136 (-) Transcript_11069:31-438(-)
MKDKIRGNLLGGKNPEKEAAAFNSSLKRDYMEQTVKSSLSPGPGFYEPGVQDRMKEIDQQISLRYQIRPFGSNLPRFEYQANKDNLKNVMLEQYPTFYDEEQIQKKLLLNEAMDKVKEMEQRKGNAVFKSQTKRF